MTSAASTSSSLSWSWRSCRRRVGTGHAPVTEGAMPAPTRAFHLSRVSGSIASLLASMTVSDPSESRTPKSGSARAHLHVLTTVGTVSRLGRRCPPSAWNMRRLHMATGVRSTRTAARDGSSAGVGDGGRAVLDARRACPGEVLDQPTNCAFVDQQPLTAGVRGLRIAIAASRPAWRRQTSSAQVSSRPTVWSPPPARVAHGVVGEIVDGLVNFALVMSVELGVQGFELFVVD